MAVDPRADGAPATAPKRVVAGRTADGTWGILHDGPLGPPEPIRSSGRFDLVWASPSLELDTTDRTADTALADLPTFGPGRSQFAICEFGPSEAPLWWHRNNTIDYQYVISGSIELELEDGTRTVLDAGDVNVQLGGTHRWWVRGPQPCLMAVVQLWVDAGDLEPYREGQGGTSG